MGLDLSSNSTLAGSDTAGKRDAVQDVLSLFDSVPPAPSATSGNVITANDSLLNLGNNSFNLDSFLSSPAAPESKNNGQEMLALNKNGLRIDFSFEAPSLSSDDTVTIRMKATNSSPFPMAEFLFQAAVPKVGGILLG